MYIVQVALSEIYLFTFFKPKEDGNHNSKKTTFTDALYGWLYSRLTASWRKFGVTSSHIFHTFLKLTKTNLADTCFKQQVTITYQSQHWNKRRQLSPCFEQNLFLLTICSLMPQQYIYSVPLYFNVSFLHCSIWL